jgi:hypothetical protein
MLDRVLLRLDHRCAQLQLRALDHTNSDLKPHFLLNDLLNTKTLKLTKTLENNKVKSLTNIS